MAQTTALPAPDLVRPRTVVIGTLFATGAALMMFFALIAIYVVRRAETLDAGREWFPEGSIELGPPGFVFATLILSVFTIQWAVSAMKAGDRTNTFWALAITAMFGAAVFNQVWFILSETGFSVDGGEAQFLFLVVNGTFAVFMIGAVVFVALTFIRALAGQFSARQSDGIVAAAMFWNAVVAMWAITWYVIYITK